MRKAAISAAAAVISLIATQAMAADLAAKAPALAPPPPPPPSWTGCYVDGGGGFGISNIDHNFNATSGAPVTVQTTSGGRGWLGTIGGGCDYQFSPATGWGNWVVGIFADYQFMDVHRSLQELATAGEEKETSAWGVGGRIGYLVTPNVFSYFTGGYTQSHFDGINFSLVVAPFSPVASIGSHTYHGWFLGGGTEISLSGFFGLPLPPGLFLRSEYRYSTFESATLTSTLAGAPSVVIGSETLKPYVQTVTTALVYRFGWVGR